MAGTSTSMKGQSKIQLYLLSDEEALILLQKHARIDHDSASSLLYEVTREIARECKGVPLAIEAVGTSLRGKSTNEWKIALDRLRDSKPVGIEEGVRDVFACVILSYDHLRSSLAKSLFLLCGLFPEDHKISKEDVFRYAVGLDLCGDVNVTPLDTTRNCVNVGIKELVDSCLVMHCEEVQEQDHVKMHNVVHDVALWVTSREGCVINVAKDQEANGRESFMSSLYEGKDQLPHQLDASKLGILSLYTKSGFELSNVSFERLKVLKVLAVISENYGEVVLPSLPQLTHLLTNLRVLRLVGCNLGDISFLESLTELEILDLHFSRFKSLPNGIAKLNKLRLLDLSWCSVEEDYYEVVGRCSQLEELHALAIIENFGRMDSYECFLDDAAFPKLHRYTLRIGQLYSEYLDIHYDVSRRIVYVGELNTSTISAIMKGLLQRAEEVGLETLYGGCKSIIPEMFEAIGGMDEVTILCLRGCSDIECFINTTFDQTDAVQAMVPRLVKLELIDMVGLKQVCRGTCKLHNLKTLEICACPMLTTLFSMSVARSLVQLQELRIINCGELKQITEVGGEDEGQGTSKFSEITCLMFSKLKTLTLHNCGKLEFIFPVSCVEGLVLLRTVQIHESSGLKYFFSHQEHHGQPQTSCGNDIQIELPSVELLQLINLPNLQSLFPENYHSRWPSLRLLNCRGCPKLTTPHSELKQPHTITISYC